MLSKLISSSIIIAIISVMLVASSSHADESADIKAVRAELEKIFGPNSQAEIVASKAKGVYQIDMAGRISYAYIDGDLALLGDLYDTKRKVNVGEEIRNDRMASVINDVPESKMIVFGPEDPKRVLTVFTDIDCGYCRKLHNEVGELNAAGIQVRYLAFPRSGIGQNSYKKYVDVWCSDDQQSALTTAKAGGGTSGTKTCDNPIAETYRLGQKVGVTGTPTIIFDDGTVTPGYLPAAVLIEKLGLDG